MKRLLGAAAVFVVTGAAAWANDTTAELKAGGLKFTHTGAVQMKSEDLYLSMDQVRVDYVFHNASAHDVTTLVAFPMPALGPEYHFEPVAIPDVGGANFMRFSTSVNGRSIPIQLTQTAMLNGADVSARVRATGLPFSQLDPKFGGAVARLTPAARADLEKRKLIENVSGDPAQPEYRALWTLHTAYSSTLTFPAGKDLVVEHSYAPIVGGSVGSILTMGDYPNDSPERLKLIKEYCIDRSFLEGAQAARARIGAEYIQERRLGYVLKTGANWAGPIGQFHLTIDKGAPDNLMSVCLPGIKKTSPTRFELTRTNFTPTKDIEVYLLTPVKPQ